MGKKSRKGRKKDPHEVTIPPGTAPGSKLTVPLPDGRHLTLTTPPGSKPGDCISLKEVDRAKNGHPSIALASGPDVDGSGRLRDILAKTRELERSAVAWPPAGIPPPGRAPTPPVGSMPLTEDEKCALMQRINGLPSEKLDLVVYTLDETSDAVTPRGGGDGNLDRVDLNTLDPTALRSLQQFVNILSATQPLTLSSLASMPAEHQKNLVGERLYPLVRRVQPELAGKITGMLLEMDTAELLHLIETPDALRLKVDEAIEVLKRHRRQVAEETDLQARRISIAAAVAEAAAKDIPPSEHPNDNERFLNAAVALMTNIATNDDDKIDLLVYAKTSVVLSVGPVEYVKKIKRWPRLRKYWPRLRRRFCSHCGKGTLDLAAPRLMVCGGCGQGRGVGRYCSEACQRAAWPEHQKHCPRLDL